MLSGNDKFDACNAKSFDLVESKVVIILVRCDVRLDAVVERQD